MAGTFPRFLKAHDRLQDLSFMSFEHYPYEPCKIQWSDLYDEPALISHIVQVWRDDGVPPNVPVFMTELNIAWNTGESFVDTFGALWLADFMGSFLSAGGDRSLLLPLSAGRALSRLRRFAGDFWMFTVDRQYQIMQPTSQFFASQLINLEWVQPGNGKHAVFPATVDIDDPAGHSLVTAYAVQRPDGQWSLMLVNKDQENAYPVRIAFNDSASKADSSFTGPVDVVTFGSEQYHWNPASTGGDYPECPDWKRQSGWSGGKISNYGRTMLPTSRCQSHLSQYCAARSRLTRKLDDRSNHQPARAKIVSPAVRLGRLQ